MHRNQPCIMVSNVEWLLCETPSRRLNAGYTETFSFCYTFLVSVAGLKYILFLLLSFSAELLLIFTLLCLIPDWLYASWRKERGRLRTLHRVFCRASRRDWLSEVNRFDFVLSLYYYTEGMFVWIIWAVWSLFSSRRGNLYSMWFCLGFTPVWLSGSVIASTEVLYHSFGAPVSHRCTSFTTIHFQSLTCPRISWANPAH